MPFSLTTESDFAFILRRDLNPHTTVYKTVAYPLSYKVSATKVEQTRGSIAF